MIECQLQSYKNVSDSTGENILFVKKMIVRFVMLLHTWDQGQVIFGRFESSLAFLSPFFRFSASTLPFFSAGGGFILFSAGGRTGGGLIRLPRVSVFEHFLKGWLQKVIGFEFRLRLVWFRFNSLPFRLSLEKIN